MLVTLAAAAAAADNTGEQHPSDTQKKEYRRSERTHVLARSLPH